jgi:hypothetical protein
VGADDTDAQRTKPRSAPEVVAPTSRVNVAFPFSHLHVEESSKDLAELSGIVADLAAMVEQAAPGPGVTKLRERAQVLRTRLQ